MNNVADQPNENIPKRKSHCFSNLLRGKKVGCFNMQENINNESNSENLKKNEDTPNFTQPQTCKNEANDEESKITNVALCCAITDTNKTPMTFKCMGNKKCSSDSYQRCNKSDKQNEFSVANRENTTDLDQSSNENGTKIQKSSNSLNEKNDNVDLKKFSSADKMNKFDASVKDKAIMKSSVKNSSSVPENRKFFKNNDKTNKNTIKNKYRPRSMSSLPQRASSLDSMKLDSLDSSLESLIKHSITTARAMYPVPIAKAKDRNYLHGRTGAVSLLGISELERIFPDREVRIFVCTWNMNGEVPPSDLGELFLPTQLETLPDIYIIGTQESYSDTSEWEVSVQETIGPTHVLFHSETLGTLYLGVFIRRELIWFCSEPEDTSFSTRPGSAFKTKGAVAVCFYLFGSSFLFITSHLTAHDDKVQERIHDVKRIIKSLELPKDLPIRHRSKDVTQNFDYIFWCGDLNFRLTQPRAQVIDWLSKQKFPLESPLQSPLYDQLLSSIRKGLVFKGFQEAPLTFKPTYKYDIGTHNFDSSHKQRVPSYTDRILYKCKKNSSILLPTSSNVNVQWLCYTSVPSFSTSDHKPVWGLYKCKIRPGSDSIPLAAGLFNREVYLDGLKRRARSRKGSNDSSVCAIQ